MSSMHENSSSVSRQQVTETYLKAIGLIDERVALYLGKATTRALVQGAATHLKGSYPFLAFLMQRPYTDIVPAVIEEQLPSVSLAELVQGLNALVDECFAGLQELTGDLLAPPIRAEVIHQLGPLR